MDLVTGKAYIGRIKASDSFDTQNMLFGIIYKGKKIESISTSLSQSALPIMTNCFMHTQF